MRALGGVVLGLLGRTRTLHRPITFSTPLDATSTLPSGASLTYRYLGAGGRYDNVTSRVTEILHGATAVVQYHYNGLGQVVWTDYPQPEIHWDLSGSTGTTLIWTASTE